jgi:hypothetical protein
MRFLKEEYEYIEIPKTKYDKAQHAIKEAGLPFSSVSDFIDQQIESLLEKTRRMAETPRRIREKRQKRA